MSILFPTTTMTNNLSIHQTKISLSVAFWCTNILFAWCLGRIISMSISKSIQEHTVGENIISTTKIRNN